jgi:hypothetical protein
LTRGGPGVTLFTMRLVSENRSLAALISGRRDLARSVAETYEHAAKSCATCETPGACCLDAHFVNVRVTRLEAAAIRNTLAEMPEDLRERVGERAREAVRRFGLDGSSTGTYACPLFERGVGCLVHNAAKPAPCIIHACYERAEDLPPDSLLEAEEIRTAELDRRTYGRVTLTPIPVAVAEIK